jgi:hypothetical protein
VAIVVPLETATESLDRGFGEHHNAVDEKSAVGHCSFKPFPQAGKIR